MKAPAAKRPTGEPTRIPDAADLIRLHTIAGQMGVTYDTVANWTKRPESPLKSWKVGQRRFTTRAAFEAFVAGGRDSREADGEAGR